MHKGFPFVHPVTATRLFCCFAFVAAAGVVHASGLTRAKSLEASRTFRQEGTAVYYSSSFNGRKTASGERFDIRKLTAAHRTLPFGSRVRVTNLRTKKSVIVLINDRGPFGRGGHIIDLSPAAAAAIGLGRRQGVARVRLVLEK
jgi:rare lipoprotein A